MSYFLEQDDPVLLSIAQKELERQMSHLEMIASENFTFPSVLEMMGSVLTNKYAEGYPAKRYYGGCELVDEAEQIAIDRAKLLFDCEFANVQPHSGTQANVAVYAGLLKAGDKILGMDLSHGGHLTHGAKPSFSGKNYQSFTYGVGADGYMDYDRIADIAKIVKPKLIICGASAYARVIDFEAFRAIADGVGAILLGDIAHISGLVVAGEHPSPFPHCDIVTSTTHKTLRGPRGGIILTNDPEYAKKINGAIFPGTQGGPLMHTIAAKAVGFGQNLKPDWKIYASQVKANAQALAKGLLGRGYDLVSGGTDNHLILMNFLNKDFSGKDAEEALHRAGIVANKNTVPQETRSPFVTSGLRLGSPALTSRGMQEQDFAYIATKIADVLDDVWDLVKQDAIREEIGAFAQKFVIYDKPIY